MFTAESLREGEDPTAVLIHNFQISDPENVFSEKNWCKVQTFMHKCGDKENITQ